MTKATNADGSLQVLQKCFIRTPDDTIDLKILPEITDSKGASYQSEPIIGRTSPIVNYSYSEPRMINTELTFMVTKCKDIIDNLRYLRLIESLLYPGDGFAGGAPYTPPPISKFICGKLLGDDGVCVILKNYSVRFQSDVAWDASTYLPYKFTVSCQWEVVYSCSNLPTNCMIRTYGGFKNPCPSAINVDWICPSEQNEG